jgi:hypothetical protein
MTIPGINCFTAVAIKSRIGDDVSKVSPCFVDIVEVQGLLARYQIPHYDNVGEH